MKKFKLLFLTLTTLTLLTSVTATTDLPKVNQADTGPDITQTEMQKKGLFDFLLDFTGVQTTYTPGEDISIEIEAETQTSYDTADATKVVEIYECADSSCDTPPPIDSSSEDQCSDREWAPEYDDCIAKDSDTVSYSTTLEPGNTWSWDASFNGLDRESEYILVGYVWTPDQGIVTDVSKEQFTMESSSTDDGSDDGSDDSTSGSANVQQASEDILVEKTQDGLRLEVDFINTGTADMSDHDIAEMQVRPKGSGLLSAISTISPQKTCDSEHPENVHREFFIAEGETLPIKLNVNDKHLTKGETYDVWLVTREECGGGPVPPYGTGTVAGTITLEAPEPEPSDTDGDGIIDENDACPETVGPQSNDGCPVDDNGGLPLGLILSGLGVLVIGGWVVRKWV